MDIDRRQPTGTRFRDRSGDVTPHGIKILDFAGFSGKFSVWRCLCPKCGDEFDMVQTAFARQKTCGRRCPGVVTKSGQCRRLYNRWNHLRHLGRLSPEWSDWDAIFAAVGPLQTADGKLLSLIPIDPSKPVGPDNFELKSGDECGISVAEYFGEPITTKQAAKILGVTRQRADQLLRDGTLQHRLSKLEKGNR